MHFWLDEVKERESRACYRFYVEWKVRVVSTSFRSETEKERSLWHSLEKRERNTVSELHHPEGNDDDYDDVADEHDLNKWLCPSTFTRGRDGREERV